MKFDFVYSFAANWLILGGELTISQVHVLSRIDNSSCIFHLQHPNFIATTYVFGSWNVLMDMTQQLYEGDKYEEDIYFERG